MVHKAYKFELRPSETQLDDLIKHAGCARYSYNWGLEQRSTRYNATGEKLNAIKLHKELNSLKQSSLSWMYEVSKCAPQEALRDLDKAFANFFNAIKLGNKVGYPKFKKKGRHDAFRLTGSIKVLSNSNLNQLDQVQLPRIGRIRV
ncbi:MAG: helix-turn-helix domain-containing protein, partial [Candidatus Heimdallarchaeota archaeon]|nr:helix-turn-helix domain-containing protein [Candidatus Heimdallarchaeota archaeon]